MQPKLGTIVVAGKISLRNSDDWQNPFESCERLPEGLLTAKLQADVRLSRAQGVAGFPLARIVTLHGHAPIRLRTSGARGFMVRNYIKGMTFSNGSN